MPKDLIFINALAKELNMLLKGGRIEKIYQPEKDELSLIIRASGNNYNLVISNNANYPGLYLRSSKKINPESAPAFCMLLRKHLLNAVIDSVEILNNDRVIAINCIAKNELSDIKTMSIIVELILRYSNIMLIDENNKIIDAIKRVYPDSGSDRIILPLVEYLPLPDAKLKIDNYEEIHRLLNNNKDPDKAKIISDNVSGISYLTARELLNISSDSEDFIINLKNFLSGKIYEPCTLQSNGKIIDIFPFPYRTLDIEGEYVRHNTLSLAAEQYYGLNEFSDKLRSAKKRLSAIINNHIKRTEKALAYTEEQLINCTDVDRIREFGDMIMSNIYKINKGMSELKAEDYFRSGTVVIPLDKTINPQQNAARYYKRYSKLSRSKPILIKKSAEQKNHLKYLQSLLSLLYQAESPEDIKSVEQELDSELIKDIKTGQKNKPKKAQKETQLRNVTVNGYNICIGRNNLDNEHITFKLAGPKDIFLHIKDAFGSHVIIFTNGREPDEDVIMKAAGYAAYYSELRQSGKAKVDYTFRRYVRRHPSGKKGMVIYTNYSTVIVEPIKLTED